MIFALLSLIAAHGMTCPEASEEQCLAILIQEFRGARYLDAAQGFGELLDTEQAPTQRTKIAYYQAKSLYALEMYQSAAHYFEEVVLVGPKDPYFKYALPHLVDIARWSGNNHDLTGLARKIPPEAYPRRAKNHLYYVQAREILDQGRLDDAAHYLGQISAKSELYVHTQYLTGVIHLQRGKIRSARDSFRAALVAAPAPTSANQLARTNATLDLAEIAIARLYYALTRYEQASWIYEQIPPTSTQGSSARLEGAWALFMLHDDAGALKALDRIDEAVTSPKKRAKLLDKQRAHEIVWPDFLPSTEILRALVHVSRCEYAEAERILTAFEAEYESLPDVLHDRQLTDDQLFERWLAPDASQRGAIDARLLRSGKLRAFVDNIAMIDRERQRIGAQKQEWRDGVGADLLGHLTDDEARYRDVAVEILKEELVELEAEVADLLKQAGTLRSEVAKMRGSGYEFARQCGDH